MSFVYFSAAHSTARVVRLLVAMVMVTLRVISCAAVQERRATLLALRLMQGQSLRVTLLALRLVPRVTLLALRLVPRVTLLALRLDARVLENLLQLPCLVGLAEKHRCFFPTLCLVLEYCPRYVVEYCPRYSYCHFLSTMRTWYGAVHGKDSSETHHLRREKRTSFVFLLRSLRADLSLNPHCCRLTGNSHSNPRYSGVTMICRKGHCLPKMPSLCLIAAVPLLIPY